MTTPKRSTTKKTTQPKQQIPTTGQSVFVTGGEIKYAKRVNKFKAHRSDGQVAYFDDLTLATTWLGKG